MATLNPTTGALQSGSDGVAAAARTNLRSAIAAHAVRLTALEGVGSPAEYDSRIDALELSTNELLAVRKQEVTEAAADQVDSRIYGLTGTSAQKLIFSTQDHVTPSYVRSATVWTRDLDLTCTSPWNSGNSYLWAGTAVTPQHIIMAQHAFVVNGATMRFITADGTVVTRTLSNAAAITGSDIRVGVLDSPLPSTITPAKVLPADYATWIDPIGLPVICFDQEEKATIANLADLTVTAVWIDEPATEPRRDFYELPVSGDSGNPCFLIVGGQTVLLGCLLFPGMCPSLHGTWRSGVEQAIISLGGTGSLTDVSFDTVVRRRNIEDNIIPRLRSYTVATVPSASVFAQGMIYVTNETGGATVAFSDGTNWRRVQDRAIVS